MRSSRASRGNWLRFVIWPASPGRRMRLGVAPFGTGGGDTRDHAVNPGVARNYRQRMGLQPQRAGEGPWIDTCGFPPCGFIAGARALAMMAAARGQGELVAHLARERPT